MLQLTAGMRQPDEGNMVAKDIAEILAALMLPAAFCGVMYHRIYTGKSITVRAIQLVAVTMLIPTILLLSLEGVLDKTSVGTLIGAFAGYILSGLSDYDKRRTPSQGSSAQRGQESDDA